MSLRREDFAGILVQHGHCGDLDEATVLADLVYQEIPILMETTEDDETIRPAEEEILEWQSLLQDVLGVEEDESNLLLKQLLLVDEEEEEEEEDASENDVADEDSDDEDSFPLFDGHCPMCERYIKLTKHHLIPKETWPRVGVKLRNAAEAKKRGDLEKATMILGDGLIHLLDQLGDAKKSSIKAIMCGTADICRPCHSHVHKTHDNLTLAWSYSTVDLLLQDENIAKFCKWVSKQKPGKYAIR
ncbi:unnamed protein product [Cylindrotheca closterium]|uniref:Uncharacterized protein n=1 Tax=Cylindrotheca closterium TaxID=2856 RepID=A0AAD2G3M9_9STRA|nr:unnamed protein product [Cylindrotheca closterium]